MNPLTLLVGIIFAALGVLFLGINMSWWSRDIWWQLVQLWPLILIILGLRFVLRSSTAFLVATLILLGIVGVVWARNPHLLFRQTVHPNGPSFNLPIISSSETSTFQEELDATDTNSFVADLNGNYDITLTGDDSSTVRVDLSGPKDILDHLTLTKLETSPATIALKQGDISGVNFLNGFGKVSGTITLPKSLTLNLHPSGVTQMKIVNHQGSASIDGSGGVSIGFVNSTSSNPSIKISGAGKVSLDRCNGEVNFDISGAGEVTAESCNASKVTISSSGGGKVDIKSGSVTNLDINSSGASSIHVPKPSGSVNQDTSGSASIKYID